MKRTLLFICISLLAGTAAAGNHRFTSSEFLYVMFDDDEYLIESPFAQRARVRQHVRDKLKRHNFKKGFIKDEGEYHSRRNRAYDDVVHFPEHAAYDKDSKTRPLQPVIETNSLLLLLVGLLVIAFVRRQKNTNTVVFS